MNLHDIFFWHNVKSGIKINDKYFKLLILIQYLWPADITEKGKEGTVGNMDLSP